MKWEYDADVDAVYCTFSPIWSGGVALMVEVDPDINLDFDESGHLIGIEVLNASEPATHRPTRREPDPA